MKKISLIGIVTENLLENHNVNANNDGHPKEVNNRAAISGQKLKFMTLNTINQLNNLSEDKRDTYVSNGDGTTTKIDKDLRADLGGYMLTSGESYSNKRTSPLSVTYSVATNKLDAFDDLFVRFKVNNEEKSDKHTEQRINSKLYSVADNFIFNWALNIINLSTTEISHYKDNFNISRQYVAHVDEVERKRRVELLINATKYLQGFANQSRNAVNNRPLKVLIIFDPMYDTGHFNFFKLSKVVKKAYLDDLQHRGGSYFLAEDETQIEQVYQDALKCLNKCELLNLSDEVLNISDFEVKYGKMSDQTTKKKRKAENA